MYNLINFLVSSLVQECTIGIGMLCYDKEKSCHPCLLCTSVMYQCKCYAPVEKMFLFMKHAADVDLEELTKLCR